MIYYRSLTLLKRSLLLLLTFISFMTQAQNPFVTDNYTADPTARVFNNRLYVYPSHDVTGCQEGQGDNNYCMPDYHVYSTDDMVNWTDHGVIIDQNSVPWVRRNSFGMWAPDCVEKNGTYYHYFPAPPSDRSAFRRIGVATSSSPTGPFTPDNNYIQGVNGFDPGVLVDDDGNTYLYFAQGGLKVVRLKNNMRSIDSRIVDIPTPAGYVEGPFTFKRGDTYYMTFAHVADRNGIRAYEIGYSTSKNPMGPFTYRGTIMPPVDPNRYDTNHASFVKFKNAWYIFYHHWSLSGNSRLRSIRADEIFFNADGTIQLKKATLRGVGIPKAGDRIQVDRHNGIHNAQVNPIMGNEPKGFQVGYIQNNGWVKFDRVDFGNGNLKKISARIASPSSGGKLEIRIGSATGKLLATINVPNTGSWENWKTVSSNFSASTSGIKNLVCVFKGTAQYLYNFNWVRFTAEKANPPSQGGIPFGETIFIKGENDRYVSARLDEAGVPLKSISSNKLKWERFQVVNAGSGKVALRSASNNNFISSRLDQAGRPVTALSSGNHDIWERFEWKSLGGNRFALKAYNNQWVSARLDETDAPLKAVASGVPLAWETFTFEKASGSRLSDSAEFQNIKLFPNPSADEVTVSGLRKGDTIIVRDLLGEHQKTIHVDDDKVQFSTMALKPGTYILSIVGKASYPLVVNK